MATTKAKAIHDFFNGVLTAYPSTAVPDNAAMVLKYIPDLLVKSKQRQVLINVKMIILDPAMDKKYLAHRRRKMPSWMRLDISI